MLLGAIADDLTGATDLALTLSRNGMKTLQVVGVPAPDADFGNADAVVVALKSRTIPAAEAVAQSLAAARILVERGAAQLYFKYCSTFDSTDRGNIGPVIDALLDLLGESRSVACPAFPENARTLYKGHLFVGDVPLSESPMKDHPLTPMRDSNLVRVLGRQTARPVGLVPLEAVHQGVGPLREALAAQGGIAVVDAITDEDLRVIGAALADMRLVTGGSALARGLPQNFRARGLLPAVQAEAAFAAPEGAGIFLAGSCSAATRRQVADAQARGVAALKVDPLAIVEGRQTAAQALDFIAAHAGDAYPPLLYSSADPDEVRAAQERLGQGEAGEIVERFLAAIAQALRQRGYRRFIVAGGETSGAVVQALGATTVAIGPEIDPGVPWVLTQGPDALCLALKSGNFGSDDFFTKAWGQIR